MIQTIEPHTHLIDVGAYVVAVKYKYVPKMGEDAALRLYRAMERGGLLLGADPITMMPEIIGVMFLQNEYKPESLVLNAEQWILLQKGLEVLQTKTIELPLIELY